MRDITGDDDADADEASPAVSQPYSIEDKIDRICQDIANRHRTESAADVDEVPRALVVESIHKWCPKGDQDEACEQTIRQYIDEVTDRLGLVENPERGMLETVEDSDAPAYEHKPFDALTPDKRVDGVRIELLRQATTHGKAQFTASDIRTEVFDGTSSTDTAHDLRERAAAAEGFTSPRGAHGKEVVRVYVNDVVDEWLLDAAGVINRRLIEEESEATMDQLDAGQQDAAQRARTDGGVDS